MGVFDYSTTWSDNTTYNYTSLPMTIYPAMVALPNQSEPEKKSDDPLDWLREQVSEICELATSI
jgi:hypothetical protein